MKSTSSMLVFIGALIIGAGFLIHFHFQSNTDRIEDKIVSKISSVKLASGQKWLSDVKPEIKAMAAGLYAIDADGHSFNLNGKTVSQYVKNLYDAANKGDVKAAYNIYAAETICTDLPQRQRELDNIPANTEQNYVESLQTLIKNSRDVCTDYNISPRERIDYLHAAAKGGNVSALLMAAREVPDGIDPRKPFDPNDPRAVQWQKDSLGYLSQAAAKGSAVAMMGLSTVYEQGDFGAPNIQLALTYEIASLMQLYPNAAIPNNYPSISRLTSQLTPDQIAMARADAAVLIKSAAKTQ